MKYTWLICGTCGSPVIATELSACLNGQKRVYEEYLDGRCNLCGSNVSVVSIRRKLKHPEH